MTSAALTRLCATWQRRLRLADWKISVQIQPEPDMPENWGASEIDAGEATGEIHLRADLDDALTERTLVHELLHFRLLPFSDGDAAEPFHEAREQAINLLADCYLAAYARKSRNRKEKPKEPPKETPNVRQTTTEV